MHSKTLNTTYKTYFYKSTSSYFIRKTIITMRLIITLENGQKKYGWTRARTAVVVRDRRNNDCVVWKYSQNYLLNLKSGDNLDGQY